MAGLDFIVRGDNSDFLNKLKEVQNGVRSTADKIEQSGMSIEDMFSRLTKAAAAFGAGFSATEFVKQIARVRGEFQQLEVAFTTMLGGSQEAANDLMQQMVKLAATTPFDLQGVADGARQLLAYGENVNNITDDLTRLGNIAAGLSQPLGDLVYLYGTTMTQGRLYTQDLNQFVGRGIPMIRELAKQMGVAEVEVRNLVTEGKIGFPEVQKVIQSLTNEGGMFYNLMQEQSKTITGQISNIEDSISMMFNNIGKSNEGVINTALSGVSYLVENYEYVGEAIMAAVTAYGSYKAVLMTVTAIQSANSLVLRQAVLEKSLAAAAGINLSNAEAIAAARTKLLTIAQLGLAKSLKAVAAATILNPFFLAAAAITGLVSVIYKYSTAASAAEEAQNGFNRSMENMSKEADELKQKVTELISVIQDMNSTPLQKQMAYDELQKIAPAVTEAYDSMEKLANAGDKWNSQFNEMTDENHLNKLKEQSTELKKLVAELSGAASSHSSVTSGSEYISQLVAKAKNITGAEGSVFWNMADWAEEAQKQLMLVDQEIQKIEDAKEKMRIPTEMEVKVAESSYNESKERLDDIERFAIALKDEIEGNSIEIPLDEESPRRKTDEIVSEIEDKVEALKKEQRDNPIQFTADKQQVLDQYSSMLTQIQSWKEQARSTGIFTIPLFVTQVRSETEQKQQRFNYLTGKYESEEEKATTLADDYKAAEKAYNNARASLAKMTANRNKYTSEEYKEATSALKTAKKNFEELGGTTQTDKQRQSAATKAANERKKEAEQRKKAQEELNKDLLSLQQQNQDDEIALMQDGTKKKLAEIDNDYKKRVAEIGKQEAEFKKKNLEAGNVSLNGKGLTKEQQDEISKSYELANKEREKSVSEAHREELESMRDYLKQWGSMEQKRLAISEEYSEKIANARNEGERKSLEKERGKALSSLTFENISMGIDWKGLLSGVSSLSKETLEPMLRQLEAYTKTDEYAKADMDERQKVVDLIKELRQYVGTDQEATWQELAKAIEAFNEAVASYRDAASDEKKAVEDLAAAKGKLERGDITQADYDKLKTAADQLGERTVEAKDEMQSLANSVNEQSDQVANQVSPLSAALNNAKGWQGADGFDQLRGSSASIDQLKGTLDTLLTAMQDGQAKAIGSALSDGMGKLSSSLGGSLSSVFSSGVGSIVGVVAQIPSMILQLADTIKNFVTGILNSISELLSLDWISDLVNSILGAIGNLIDTILDLPENLFHVLEGIVVQGVGGLLNSVVGRLGNILSFGALSSGGPAEWFSGSNAEEVAKTIERLTERNKLLQQSIEDLTSTIEGGEGTRSVTAYEEAVRLQEEMEQNLLEMARAQAGYSGSHHSWNAYWGGFTQDEIAELSRRIGRDWNGDLFDLSPEEMKELRSMVDTWARIQNTGKGGYGGRLTEKLDDYIEQAGQMEELTDQLNESLTQVSFDSIYDSFISTLMDMDASAEDFANDFSEYMMRALLSNQVGEEMKKQLKDWYGKWAEYMKDNKLTDMELSDLRGEWDNMVQQGLEMRDQLAEAIGYTGESSKTEQQSASSKGFETMSQDTADELNGRFTALYEVGLRIDDSSRNIRDSIINTVTGINSLVSLTTDGNAELRNILSQQVIANSHLEDIVKYTKPISELGVKLDKIVSKVNNL